MTIDIKVKERTLVKPAEKTPRQSLWLSDLDLLYDEGRGVFLYVYKSNGTSNFFDSAVLKEALAKVLVPYYPIAGRLRHGDDGRLEINCNDEGVLFVVAETSSVIDDFGDFTTPQDELRKLASPAPDYSAGISSFPLLVLQVTYFQCGGVSLSFSVEHRVVDGASAFNFVNAWSEIARGRQNLTVQPIIDRTLLRPRDPLQVMLNHTEYRLTDQSIKDSEQNIKSKSDNVEKFKVVVVKITRDQLNILKAKAKEDGNTINYSTFVILVGLIWKCTCIARALPKDQETKLFFSANGRSRLQSPLPLGYFGNVIFQTTTVALAGDVQSKPLWYAVSRIQETLMQLDSDYLRSVIDFLKLHPNTKRNRYDESKSPNLGITSWANFPTRDADFGWGQPFHTGHCGIVPCEGRVWIIDDGTKDGSLSVVLSLQPERADVFEKLFYKSVEQLSVRNSFGRSNL